MKNCIPKKFLCRFPLAIGAFIVGIVMIIVKAICLMITVVVMIDFSQCNTNCTDFVSNNSYGFNITAMIYIVVMILVHFCFIWAVKKKKPAFIIVWVAVTTLWLFKTICLTAVLLFLYSKQTSFVIFIACVVFAVISFCIAVYALLIAVGLWLEMLPENTGQNP